MRSRVTLPSYSGVQMKSPALGHSSTQTCREIYDGVNRWWSWKNRNKYLGLVTHPKRMKFGDETRQCCGILQDIIKPFKVSGPFVRVHQNILHHTGINDAPTHAWNTLRFVVMINDKRVRERESWYDTKQTSLQKHAQDFEVFLQL